MHKYVQKRYMHTCYTTHHRTTHTYTMETRGRISPSGKGNKKRIHVGLNALHLNNNGTQWCFHAQLFLLPACSQLPACVERGWVHWHGNWPACQCMSGKITIQIVMCDDDHNSRWQALGRVCPVTDNELAFLVNHFFRNTNYEQRSIHIACEHYIVLFTCLATCECSQGRRREAEGTLDRSEASGKELHVHALHAAWQLIMRVRRCAMGCLSNIAQHPLRNSKWNLALATNAFRRLICARACWGEWGGVKVLCVLCAVMHAKYFQARTLQVVKLCCER